MIRFNLSAVVLAFGLLLLATRGRVMAETEQEAERTEYRHRAELFLGVAHEESSDEFAEGIGYEHRISHLLGLGGFVEHAGAEEEAWTFGVPLFVHPYKGVRLLLAPGWELKEVKVEDPPSLGSSGVASEVGESEETEHERSFLVRAGVAYEVEAGRWSIAPEFNVDFIEGGHQVLVYGVSFGCGF